MPEEPAYVEAVRSALASVGGSLAAGGASGSTRVYKDECTFSFDSPRCSAGLFVSCKTFQVGRVTGVDAPGAPPRRR